MSKYQKVFLRSLNAEKLDLNKLGWSECRNDNEIYSYIRGYILRNFKLKIKNPLDLIIHFMIEEALSEQQRLSKSRGGK